MVYVLVLKKLRNYFNFQWGINFGKKKGFIRVGDPVVCISGWRKGAGSSNTIR